LPYTSRRKASKAGAPLGHGSTWVLVNASNDLPWISDDNRSVWYLASHNRSRADDTVFAYNRARHEDREGSNEAIVTYKDASYFFALISLPGGISLRHTKRFIDSRYGKIVR
jgi:hypothetical protein